MDVACPRFTRLPSRCLHFATYFDRHYLTRGLALYRSLVRHSVPFRLSVLCMDETTRKVLARLCLPEVELITLVELERLDPALLAVKDGRSWLEYYWTCGPALLAALFERDPGIELLTYLDADLYFFSDPRPGLAQMEQASIGLVESRNTPLVMRITGVQSRFNVGLLSLRRTDESMACLRRWREQCLEWCYDRPEGERYGDQGYLNEWPATYPGLVVLEHPGLGLASFNVDSHQLSQDHGRVYVDGQPLIYYHFTQLRMILPWLLEPNLRLRGQTMTSLLKRAIYAPYLRELQRQIVVARGIDPGVPWTDRQPTRRLQVSLASSLRHRTLLVMAGQRML